MAKQKGFDIRENYIENIVEKPIEKLLPDSMLPFSEYVILDRALPRVEDGLKPVQRRILYAMNDMGMKPEGAYKKSARVVGECLGKYHPHGDQSVYDAMVRMAQDFNMRMTLVDGHGNFGSIDGDSAAAMRYTEVKLAPLAMELLRDLEKGTVKWNKNFDDTLNEPDILPGRFPNLLVNGAMGIAIGLATNIPPHNLTEVIDGTIALIDTPNMKLPALVQIIKGPDFPTGAFMLGGQSILEMYETGHGKVTLRAKADIESDGDRQNIVVTEIPYNVNKEALQKRIYDLKEAKKEILGGIADVVDESDRNGMRIVIKLKKGENAINILNYLLQKTDLECNFNVNMVAIAAGKPKQMGLIEILKYYIDYQKTIIVKRSKHEIAIAQKREHILEGLRIVLPNIDEVIAIIRHAPTRAEAKVRLRERFELTDAQAEAVLCLQLGNINKLDITKFENELAGLKKDIERLSKIIGSVHEQNKVLKTELAEIRDRYKAKRLTTIVENLEELDVKPFDPTKRAARRGLYAVDAAGGVKFMSSRSYSFVDRDVAASGEGGLTVSLVKAEPEEMTLIFGSGGNCYRADDERIKEKKWAESGTPLAKLYADAESRETAVRVLSFNPEEAENKSVYIFTRLGYVKHTVLKQYIVNKDVYQVISLKDGDEVIGVELKEDDHTVLFVTSDGLAVNTLTDDYPLQGRIAGGVIGAKLNTGAHVVFAGQLPAEVDTDLTGKTTLYPVGEVVVVTSRGAGKKVIAGELEPMLRSRKGIKIAELPANAKIIFAATVLDPYELAILAEDGTVHALETDAIRIENRATKGKPIAGGAAIKRVVKHISEI